MSASSETLKIAKSKDDSTDMPVDAPEVDDKSEKSDKIQKLRRESSCSLLSTILSLPLHEKSLANYKALYFQTIITALEAGNFEAFKKLFEGFDVSENLANYHCDKSGGTILHVAVRSKNADCLKLLLGTKEIKELIEYYDAKGMTPLVAAALICHKECVDALIQQGAILAKIFRYIPEKVDGTRKSIIETAIEEHQVDLFKFLLRYMPESHLHEMIETLSESPLAPIIKSNNSESPLAPIIKSNNYVMLNCLLEHYPKTIEMISLKVLLDNANFKAVVTWLQKGASRQDFLSYSSLFGDSALDLAISGVEEQLLEYFLTLEGIEILLNKPGNGGITPLFRSILNNNFKIFKLLRDKGASFDSLLQIKYQKIVPSNSSLSEVPIISWLACNPDESSLEILKLLLQDRKFIDQALHLHSIKDISELYTTLFYNAVHSYNIKLLRHLYSLGCDFTSMAEKFEEDLVLKVVLCDDDTNCTDQSKTECLNFLLQRGFSLDKLLTYEDDEGNSILFSIIDRNEHQLLDLLLGFEKFKPLVQVRNDKDETPLFCAAMTSEKSPTEIIKLLIEKSGADTSELVNFRADDNKKSLLCYSKSSEECATLQYYLTLPCFDSLIDVPDQSGKTPAVTAMINGKADILKSLLEKGAKPEFLYDYLEKHFFDQILDPEVVDFLFSLPKFNNLVKTKKDLKPPHYDRDCALANKAWREMEFSSLFFSSLKKVQGFVASLKLLGIELSDCLSFRDEDDNALLSVLIQKDDYHTSYKYLASSAIGWDLMKIPNKFGKRALDIALERGDRFAVKVLLENARRDDTEFFDQFMKTLLDFRDDSNNTILTMNDGGGDEQESDPLFCRFILSHRELRPLLKVRDSNSNKTVLMEVLKAASNSDAAFYTFSVLLDCGADFSEILEYRDEDGNNILGYLIIEEEGNDDDHENKALKFLLQSPEIRQCIDLPNSMGLTPLMLAIDYCRLNAIKVLLRSGASLNKALEFRDREDNTLLGYCLKTNGPDFWGMDKWDYYLSLPGVSALLEHRNKHGNSLVVTAVLKGGIIALECLLKAGVSKQSLIDYRDKNGNSIINIAAKEGFVEVMKVLCSLPELKSLINHINKKGETPLLQAALYGDCSCIKLLIENGAFTDILEKYQDQEGNPLLLSLLKSYNPDGSHKMINGELLNLLASGFLNENFDSIHNRDLLLVCVLNGCVENFKVLQSEATVTYLYHYRDLDDNTILHRLIQHNVNSKTFDMIKHFVHAVPSPEILFRAKNKQGQRPLDIALSKGSDSSISALCTHELLKHCMIDMEFEDSNNILSMAVKLGNSSIVYFLMGIEDVRNHLKRKVNAHGHTAEMLSVLTGYRMIQNWLGVSAEGFVNYIDGDGNTLLSEAAAYGYKYGLAEMLKFPAYKAKILQSNHHLRTPLYRALLNGNKEIIQLLVDNGAESFTSVATNRYMNRTILATACSLNAIDEVRNLLSIPEFRSLLDVPESAGRTPLAIAVHIGSIDLFKLLLNAGSMLDIKDVNSKTILDLADEPSIKPEIKKLIALIKDFAMLDRTKTSQEILEGIKACIKNEISLEIRVQNGQTLLQVAALKGELQILGCLLGEGADLAALDNMGNTTEQLIAALAEKQKPEASAASCAWLLIKAINAYDIEKNIESARDLLMQALKESKSVENKEMLASFYYTLAKWLQEDSNRVQEYKIETILGLFLSVPENTSYSKKAHFEAASLLCMVKDPLQATESLCMESEDPIEALQQLAFKALENPLANAYRHAFKAGDHPGAEVFRIEIQGRLEDKRYTVNQIDLLNPLQAHEYFISFLVKKGPVLQTNRELKQEVESLQAKREELKGKIEKLKTEKLAESRKRKERGEKGDILEIEHESSSSKKARTKEKEEHDTPTGQSGLKRTATTAGLPEKAQVEVEQDKVVERDTRKHQKFS